MQLFLVLGMQRLIFDLQGGPTIVKLQFLLKQGHFGPHGHPDMILSVNTGRFPSERL